VHLHRKQAEEWVFPSALSKAGHVNVIGGGLDTPHALRRTYSSIALDAEGVRSEDVDWLLGHVKKGMIGHYNIDRVRLEEYRLKQERISARILAMLGLDSIAQSN
jgi:integrase